MPPGYIVLEGCTQFRFRVYQIHWRQFTKNLKYQGISIRLDHKDGQKLILLT